MNASIIFAFAIAFALGCFGTAAAARNWLTNEPDAPSVPFSDLATPPDITVNFGARARVRLYRPDGEYEIHNGKYERAPSVQGDADADARPMDN